MHRLINSCRICGNKHLTEILYLGDQFLASAFVKNNAVLSPEKIPLTVMLCNKEGNPNACGLVQLKETVQRNEMYGTYFYRSATNPMMRDALKEIVQALSERVHLKENDYVLDIGCNDGTLLSFYPESLYRVGIDPAQNIDRSYLNSSIQIVKDYFSKTAILSHNLKQTFKAISSIAMFYDLDDPNTFVADIKSILDPEGIWCIQLSYLPTTLKTLNFYDICHEHLLYYSLEVLEFLLKKHDLYIFDADLNDVNGGSLRVFVTHTTNSKSISENVSKIRAEEKVLHLDQLDIYKTFSNRIDHLKKVILNYLTNAKKKNFLVIGLGASTKGNVLLQAFHLTSTLLPAISERNPEKIGLYTLGTNIELISETQARALKPACMLVLIWFFKDELLKREKDYLEAGGKLLFPMPYPHMVTKDGEHALEEYEEYSAV